MAIRYRITYKPAAEHIRNSLPRAAQTTLTALLQQLGNDPFTPGTYNRSRKNYTAGLGQITIVYTVHSHIVTVEIIRIVWSG